MLLNTLYQILGIPLIIYQNLLNKKQSMPFYVKKISCYSKKVLLLNIIGLLLRQGVSFFIKIKRSIRANYKKNLLSIFL